MPNVISNMKESLDKPHQIKDIMESIAAMLSGKSPVPDS